MSNVKKMNTLVSEIFGDHVENLSELWVKNTAVQKQLKNICGNKNILVQKDPNAPKRGKSAYLFFCADHRDAVKKSLGDEARATLVTKELGIRWNALKASSKSTDKKALTGYLKAAETDKNRYEAEKVDYVPPSGLELTNRRRGGKKVGGPKRATSAYLFFCTENREKLKKEQPGMKATEVTSELGKLWNELKDDPSRKEELQGFEKLAATDKVRYEKEKLGNNTPTPTPTDTPTHTPTDTQPDTEPTEPDTLVVKPKKIKSDEKKEKSSKGKGKGKGKSKSVKSKVTPEASTKKKAVLM